MSKPHLLLPLAVALAASPGLRADEPTAAAPAPEPAPEIIELSPFRVDTSADEGYAASATLSGLRLNTQLRDTPAIIDVFTKQFLEDIGATSLEDAVLYSNNSVGDDGGNDGAINATSADQTSSFRFLSRGIRATRTRNYFESILQTNLYNVDRLDDSRGPNSVLFGIGSAGGSVNSTTKFPRLDQVRGEFAAQYGRYESSRAALDLNVPLVQDKLGVRLNGLLQDRNQWRWHLGDRIRAIDFTVAAAPFKGTLVRAGTEAYEFRGTTARNYPVNDQISKWLVGGSPVTSTVSANSPTATQTAGGVTRRTTANLTYVEDQNFVFNAQNAWFSAPFPGSEPGYSTVLNRPDIVPYESNMAGPGTTKAVDVNNATLMVEHRFNRDLAIEFGFYHEAESSLKHDIDGTPFIYGDPNGLIRNPTFVYGLDGYTPERDASNNFVNPNAGKFFLDSNWQRFIDEFSRDTGRLSASYNLDFGKAGYHRLAAYGALQDEETTNYSEREVWSGIPFNADPLNTANSLIRRRYIEAGDARGQYFSYPQANPELSVVFPGRSEPLRNVWAQKSGGTMSTREIFSQMVASQSFFFDGRLVTTFGYRRDELDQTRTESQRDTSGIWAGSTGQYGFTPAAIAATQSFGFTGNTKTFGAVFHATPSVSLFANGSDNLGLPNFVLRVGPDGEAPPPPTGEGRDAGILLNLFDGKLVARMSYFFTAETDRANSMGVNGFVMQNYNSVMNALLPYYTADQLGQFPLLRPAALATADTLDNENEGYEVRITANAGWGVRFNLNYSYSVQDRTNVYKRTLPMFEDLEGLLDVVQAANPGIIVDELATTGGSISGLANIRQTLDYTYGDLDNRREDFESAFGNRRHKANLFVNYAPRSRKLRGWSTGFGVRYLSEPIIGRQITRPGAPLRTAGQGGVIPVDQQGTGEVVFGPDSLEFDAMLRYGGNVKLFGRRSQWSIQLNVRNVTDERGIAITRYKSDGLTMDRFSLLTPRDMWIQARLTF